MAPRPGGSMGGREASPPRPRQHGCRAAATPLPAAPGRPLPRRPHVAPGPARPAGAEAGAGASLPLMGLSITLSRGGRSVQLHTCGAKQGRGQLLPGDGPGWPALCAIDPGAACCRRSNPELRG